MANLGGELEGSEPCREVLQTSMRGYRGKLLGAIKEAQADHLFRDDLPAEAMADLLVATWEGAVIRMKIERSLEPVELCLEQLLDGYFHPSAPPPAKPKRKRRARSS